MTPFDFEFLRKLLKTRSGLSLSADKTYLLEGRLLPVARKAGVDGLSGLVKTLQTRDCEALIVEVVEAMATSETFFFRDKLPFQHLRDVIVPRLLAARAAQRRMRIWCAACSTGQEPYSIAMALKEMGDTLLGWRIEIIATDFSTEVLDRARLGRFSQFEVQRGLPIQYLIKYFTQSGEMWQVSPVIQNMVRFQQFNLLDDVARLGAFDVVFCRNVLIYFDPATKTTVFSHLARATEADGYLVLGAAETVVGLSDMWNPLPEPRGLYMPNRDRSRTGAPRLSVVAGSRIA